MVGDGDRCYMARNVRKDEIWMRMIRIEAEH